VNLPAKNKLVAPRYQDIAPDRIVQTTIDDATVRLVAGEVKGARGPVEGIVTAPQMLDVKLPARAGLTHALPATHNAFVYVLEGAAEIGAGRSRVGDGQIAVLGPGDSVSVRSEGGARMLLLAGQPIGEPVARSGPFGRGAPAGVGGLQGGPSGRGVSFDARPEPRPTVYGFAARNPSDAFCGSDAGKKRPTSGMSIGGACTVPPSRFTRSAVASASGTAT
jgi:Pirin C-terminal cupin domain